VTPPRALPVPTVLRKKFSAFAFSIAFAAMWSGLTHHVPFLLHGTFTPRLF